MPSQDRVDDAPARKTESNAYLAPALRAAAAAHARTARIRAQIGGAQFGAAPAIPAAVRRPPTPAAAAPGARFARTVAEIERQLALPASAAALGLLRRPARLSSYPGGHRTGLWARLWSGLGRWMFE
jgi:hypothetical protein